MTHAVAAPMLLHYRGKLFPTLTFKVSSEWAARPICFFSSWLPLVCGFKGKPKGTPHEVFLLRGLTKNPKALLTHRACRDQSLVQPPQTFGLPILPNRLDGSPQFLEPSPPESPGSEPRKPIGTQQVELQHVPRLAQRWGPKTKRRPVPLADRQAQFGIH